MYAIFAPQELNMPLYGDVSAEVQHNFREQADERITQVTYGSWVLSTNSKMAYAGSITPKNKKQTTSKSAFNQASTKKDIVTLCQGTVWIDLHLNELFQCLALGRRSLHFSKVCYNSSRIPTADPSQLCEEACRASALAKSLPNADTSDYLRLLSGVAKAIAILRLGWSYKLRV